MFEGQWQGSSLMGFRLYPIEIKLVNQSERIRVARRFNDLLWLNDRLKDKFAGCIIPPCPEKSLMEKLSANTSDSVEKRRELIEKYLN